MRTPNLGTVFYSPEEPPSDPARLPFFLRTELQKINGALSALALGHLDKTTAAPTKPREGDIRLADGTLWNPGAGAGFYGYHSGTWNKLG